MLSLPNDIVLLIANELLFEHSDKINLVRTCKKWYVLKDKIIFFAPLHLSCGMVEELSKMDEKTLIDHIWVKKYNYPIKNFKHLSFTLLNHLNILKIFDNVIYLSVSTNGYEDISDYIPKSVKYLKIGPPHNMNGSFHVGLEEIEFSGYPCRYSYSLEKIIPNTVRKIRMKIPYHKPINYFPDSVVELHLFLGLGSEISFLPKNLKKITISSGFNYSLKGILPDGLEEIELGIGFDQTIENTFPSSVRKIIFGFTFNKPVEGYLPDKLEVLHFGDKFNQPLGKITLMSLTELKLGTDFSHNIGYYPLLKVLIISNNIRFQVPHTVVHLFLREKIKIVIPGFIEKVCVGWGVRCGNLSFSNSVKEIEFDPFFNEAITVPLPNSLKTIKFGLCFNQSIDHIIPDSVTTIVFEDNFDHPIDNLPASVKHLSLGYKFLQHISDRLLNQLETLKISRLYRKYHPDFIMRSLNFPVLVTIKN